MNVLIKVKESHIKSAQNALDGKLDILRQTKCPVALAIGEKTKKHIRVFGRLAWIEGIGEIELPIEARQIINDFDDSNSATPAEFYIAY